MTARKLLMFVFLVIIITLINYGMFAFVFWEINPEDWKEGARYLFVCLFIEAIIVSCIILNQNNKHE